ncbi:MAG: hypothetical protein DWQ05_00265 [Calditrichaeota bacterium]|nr:MAG: hypothetical protein DWQ05_00265 [Calditrichota bacterium]
MAKSNNQVIGGIFLIAIGAILFLNELRYPFLDGAVWGAFVIFVFSMIAFWGYFQDRAPWKLILGIFLLFLAAIILAEQMGYIYGDYRGAFVLWSLAAAFLGVFFIKRDQWWALIPAGVLATLGLIVTLEAGWYFNDDFIPVILFFGFSTPFWILFFLRNDTNKLGWAIWPAAILLIFSVMLLGKVYFWDFEEFFFPGLLILIGGLLIFRSLRKDRNPGPGL